MCNDRHRAKTRFKWHTEFTDAARTASTVTTPCERHRRNDEFRQHRASPHTCRHFHIADCCPISKTMVRQGTATLAPVVREWTNEQLLECLLRRGPKCFDPNLGREHMDGWYDDERSFTVEEFERVSSNASKDDHNDFSSRLQTALHTLEGTQFMFFFDSLIRLNLVDLGNLDRLKRSMAAEMARRHVESWHRFRMVPTEVIRMWEIDGVHDEGRDDCLVCLPTCHRRGCQVFHQQQIPAAFAGIRQQMETPNDGVRNG